MYFLIRPHEGAPASVFNAVVTRQRRLFFHGSFVLLTLKFVKPFPIFRLTFVYIPGVFNSHFLNLFNVIFSNPSANLFCYLRLCFPVRCLFCFIFSLTVRVLRIFWLLSYSQSRLFCTLSSISIFSHFWQTYICILYIHFFLHKITTFPLSLIKR